MYQIGISCGSAGDPEQHHSNAQKCDTFIFVGLKKCQLYWGISNPGFGRNLSVNQNKFDNQNVNRQDFIVTTIC